MNDSKAIERIEPMKMHKNLVILFLRDHPDELRAIFPDQFTDAAEAIRALEANPGQWFVGGVLQES